MPRNAPLAHRRARAARAAGATAGNACRRTRWPTGKGPSAAVNAGTPPASRGAAGSGSGRSSRVWWVSSGWRTPSMNTASAALDPFERIARPDDDVGAPAGREAADLAAHADRLGRPRGDHRQRLAPADAGRAGHALQRDEIAGILPLHEQVARVVVVDHADRDLDPGGAHPADVRLGRRDLLERWRAGR